MSVWLAQCLCPKRHAILGLAGEAETREAAQQIAAALEDGIAEMIATAVLNPWCGLCHAGRESWTIEVAETQFHTLAEAAPVLRQSEAENIATGLVHGELGGISGTKH